MSDKDLAEILPLFPKSAEYYFVAPNTNRALPAEVLKNQAQTFELIGDSFTNVSSGLAAAKKVSSPRRPNLCRWKYLYSRRNRIIFQFFFWQD